ncbi:unnamed protein product [Mytilus coruscus]|uniref:Uncharacterized protein n=1 Tax=Mytilus coruscus TaxID=42192 RepID=A0A6J8F120_MYTCO|nr:unnamed protein product [Mytilus coruscus]
MNAVCDNVSRDDTRMNITSGSFGEGLQMLGSDLDIMWVLQFIEVHDNIKSAVFNPSKPYLSLMTEDTKPGFAMLRLVSSPYSGMLNICEQFRKDTYLSNVLFKTIFLNEFTQFVHGPCMSDMNGDVDIAVCLHSLGVEHNNVSRLVYNLMFCTSKKLKYIHAYFMSTVCKNKCQSIYLSSTISNKNQYKQYNTCLSYLLMNINHDKSKCKLEKLFRETELSVTQRLLFKWHLEQKQGVVCLLKSVLVDYVIFAANTFIPIELLTEESHFEVPPVVYAHFLSFLCHYHLNNVRECRNSLRDLELTIAEDYFIGEDVTLKSSAYYCLGTALQLIGDNESAKQVFLETAKLYPHPRLIRPLERLLLNYLTNLK